MKQLLVGVLLLVGAWPIRKSFCSATTVSTNSNMANFTEPEGATWEDSHKVGVQNRDLQGSLRGPKGRKEKREERRSNVRPICIRSKAARCNQPTPSPTRGPLIDVGDIISIPTALKLACLKTGKCRPNRGEKHSPEPTVAPTEAPTQTPGPALAVALSVSSMVKDVACLKTGNCRSFSRGYHVGEVSQLNKETQTLERNANPDTVPSLETTLRGPTWTLTMQTSGYPTVNSTPTHPSLIVETIDGAIPQVAKTSTEPTSS